MMTRSVRFILLATFGTVLGSTSVAVAAPDPFTGTWTIRLDQSKFPHGHAPLDETAIFTDDGKTETLRALLLPAHGDINVDEYHARFNGPSAPMINVVTGEQTGTVRLVRTDAFHVVKTGFDKKGKAGTTIRRVISPDGQVLTDTITAPDGSLASLRVFIKRPLPSITN